MVKNASTLNGSQKHIKSSAKQINTSVNFTMNKSLGQHLLTSNSIVESIVRKSGVSENDTVLEIGPGSGILTLAILPKCKKLIAVEFDVRMQAEIMKTVRTAG
jgi:18S rRNA (adenine1779-N6/adenine1780-N6)-dimethyltransferase